jgi:hypothetical protein
VRVIKRAVIVVGVAWAVVLGYAMFQVMRDELAKPGPAPQRLGAGNGDVRWH